MMKFEKLEAITPTEYSRDIYIDKMLSLLGSEVKSVCDVGCGVGNLLLVLEDRLTNATGIDSSEESVRLARAKIKSPHIKLEKKDAFDLDEQYDLVLFTDILEHVRDDGDIIRFLHDKIVRKGGHLILTVPAHGKLYSQFDRSAGHYRRYDKDEILALLKTGGFETIRCWCYGQLLFHYIANFMLFIDGKKRIAKSVDTDADLDARTRVSAIRQFSKLAGMFVSRVNIIHHLCFALDYIFKDRNYGIGYCILCRSS